MAITPVLSEPKAEEGPKIDDKPTNILTFSAQQLKSSNLLPGLVKTINLAYFTSEKKSLGESTGARLGSIDELILVLRDDPESFIIVLSQPHSPEEVLSTATCRRYYGPGPDFSRPWECCHTPDANTEEWELKLLATHPSAQGKGLASYMLGLAEREVAARFRAKLDSRAYSECKEDGIPAQTKMILCTPKPLFGIFYAQRGYQEDYLKFREKPGFDFEIAFMSKLLVERLEG